jgi:hypothetical protein
MKRNKDMAKVETAHSLARATSLAKKIVQEILDKGLAVSTWRDVYPDAYENLLEYRADLEESAVKILRRAK